LKTASKRNRRLIFFLLPNLAKTHRAVCFITFDDTDSANYSLQNILPASIGLRDSPTGVIRLFNILRRSPTNYHRDHAGWIAKALPAVVTG
jgi:hypothetical protein